MTEDLLFCQISDTHFMNKGGKIYDQIETYSQFTKVIEYCKNLNPNPDFYIMSGDLIHDNHEYYQNYVELCNQLNKPYYLMMGNHDIRKNVKEHIINIQLIDKSGFINFTIDNFSLKIICLDTVIEGGIEGELTSATLNWLEQELEKDSAKSTIIFMHHPPIKIGSILFDDIKCKNGNDFLSLIKGYSNILKIVFGHVHCIYSHSIENLDLISCPSSSFQFPIESKTTKNLLLDDKAYIQLFKWKKNKFLENQILEINNIQK